MPVPYETQREPGSMTQATPAGLFELREALREHGAASLSELALRLRRPQGVVEAMLEHWSRRGHVQVLPPRRADGASGAPAPSRGCGGGSCGSCGACAAPTPGPHGGSHAVLYAWREQRCLGLHAAPATGAEPARHRLRQAQALR